MNVYSKNKGGRRFAPWPVFFILSIFTACILFAPSTVLARNFELSQECATALVGSEHKITATGTKDDGTPLADFTVGFWVFSGPNAGAPGTFVYAATNADGVAEFSYTGISDGEDSIWLIDLMFMNLGSITTTWTVDNQKAELLSCMEPKSQNVIVGGHARLNVKKKGALKISICNSSDLNVHDVDPDSVKLMGVEPVRYKFQDKEYCPGGEDGFVDLTFKFKNMEVVKALEKSLGKELVDGQQVELELTGSFYGGEKSINGTFPVEIHKKGKVRGKKHKEKKEHKHEHKKGKEKVAKK